MQKEDFNKLGFLENGEANFKDETDEKARLMDDMRSKKLKAWNKVTGSDYKI